MAKLAESHVEAAALAWLAELGYATANGPDLSPEGATPERASYADVVLADRVRAALARVNPHLPAATLDEVAKKIRQTELPDLIQENRRLHRLLVEGVDVEVERADGSIGGDKAWLLDFSDPANNDWLAVSQLMVIEHGHERRADVVIFINGLPLGVVELKSPGNEQATLAGAYNQLQTYKAEIPSLFRTNAVAVTSDGLQARIGSLTASLERFMPWRTVDGQTIASKGAPELETLLRGVFEPQRFLALVRDFTVFADKGDGLVKIVAGYHQFHAVEHAVTATVLAAGPAGDRRIGVIWHTQGSGKSLLMSFYAGRIIDESALANPTIVVITDRNDLDDQLFGTFSLCQSLLRQTPQQADSREDLQRLLSRPSGGVVFTTIQKFAPAKGEQDYPLLTDRRNVVVIADEAHRSQYGFNARVDQKTGEVAYGFAKYLRDALPNASFIGFTGTPIEQDDVNTPAVFGEYIDVYDINRAVEDGATVPIYYESRLARVELDDDARAALDEDIDEITEDEEASEQERLKRKWSNVDAHHVRGQADARPRADAGHRPGQPRLPRQAGGTGGGLYRHRPTAQERAQGLLRQRPPPGRHRRGRGRCGAAGESRGGAGHVPRLRLRSGRHRHPRTALAGTRRRHRLDPDPPAGGGGEGGDAGGQEAGTPALQRRGAGAL